MISDLPFYISAVFIFSVMLSLYFIIKAGASSVVVIGIMVLLITLQGVLGYNKFFTVTDTVPPRFPFLIIPPVLLILYLLFSKNGKHYTGGLNSTWLTWLHVVRIPVEIVLFWLFTYKQIPQLMIWEGRNFDIISGITAPFIAYFGYRKHTLNKTTLLVWNIICLGLVLNILVNGLLSAPLPFQQFAFDQPNVAVMYFPFVWLPGFIVPLVIYAHIVCIQRLVGGKK